MGTRSFDLVDYKLAEAHFFLQQLKAVGADFGAAGFFFSAFVSAARSVTFSIQAVLSDADGFDGWYTLHQDSLRKDQLARFFHEARRIGQHVGQSPVRGGSGGPGKPWVYHFTPCEDFPSVPTVDVATACTDYLKLLVEIVFDCYIRYGELIDPHQYYTKEAFERRGLTLSDAEEELIGSFVGAGSRRSSPFTASIPADYRWQMLRDSVPGCRVEDLFVHYLNKTKPGPVRLDPPPAGSIPLPQGWTRNEGWVLPPGFNNINTYLDELKAGRAPPNW